jgi:ParB family chromosome partitioning protein
VIFEALGAGEISLDAAKAYAATPDHERQAYVFDQMGRSYGTAHPDSIRRMMTQATVSASDRRALFVGEEAYLAAGGRIERDLFTEDAGARWLDIAILERLACEKMEAEAARVAAETGYGFVRPTLDSWVGHNQTQGLRRLSVEKPPMSDEEAARLEGHYEELEELAELLQDETADDAERVAAEAKVRLLGDRIDALENRPPVIDEAMKPGLGAFLLLDEQGRPRLDAGVYADPSAGGAEVGEDESDDDQGESTPPKKADGLSQRLIDELAMQRRDILALHVAADPAIALDLAIFLMVDGEGGYCSEKKGSSLVAAAPSNPIFDFKTPEAQATVAHVELREGLDRGWTEGATRAERFDAFRRLNDDARADWLGHAVARTLEASLLLPGERACAFHDHLGTLLGIDVARWWRPTGANYFDRVPKSVTLAALAEVGGAGLAERYAKARKAELSQACERIFSGDFIAEIDVKEAALAWVPGPMRFAALAAATPEPEAGGETEACGEAVAAPDPEARPDPMGKAA